MTTHIYIENASTRDVPDDGQFSDWVRACLEDDNPGWLDQQPTELAIRIVSTEEMSDLNGQYRHQPKPTNVLSFPTDMLPTAGSYDADGPPLLLGDIAICAEVVEREAQAQSKILKDHYAHLCIHGTLHLLGYDHQEDGEAALMESKEAELLAAFGIPDPYSTNNTDTLNY